MSDKLGTTWGIEPITEAKHEILRYYLGAWFPILASVHRRLLYVDGFPGPGEHSKGEDGSPIFALKVARDHVLGKKLQRPGMELVSWQGSSDELVRKDGGFHRREIDSLVYSLYGLTEEERKMMEEEGRKNENSANHD